MEPLLQIKTIPLKYEMKIQKAELRYAKSKSEVLINKENGGLDINSKPIKSYIDTYEARSSITPTTMESVRQAAASGLEAASEAAATYTEEAALLLDAKVPNPLDQIFRQRAQMPTGEFGLAFIPTTGPDLEWSAPDLNIKYQMDKLSFDIRAAKGDFEFIPGTIEFSITQMPDVEIEYIGKPMYVPPSAAKFFDHAPIDVLA
ncbi:DUF6470 family protein [Clostridium boliviensis]|uniref:DUF6470 family protein n=1 Tax=Clostridium boliviensis TaxID=318465 RepID=A0ABU4GKH2_9CLOT|nr:DUF6470 family protein [Clostridium boliviensis]MDW2798111.1 DUF6470 family protein [Clostridium boliviensis]